MRKQKLMMFAVLFFTGALFAEINIQVSNNDMKLGLSGAGWQEVGQFVVYNNRSPADSCHLWISHTFLDLTVNATYRERLNIALGIEGRMWFNIPKASGTGQATYIHEQNSTFIISDANMAYAFGDVNKPYLSVKAGLFPFKYNQNVRNLGEYLFRTGTYPAYIVNNFDLPFARLTGLKASSDLFGCFHQDLILSMETRIPPFNDASLTYLADYTFKNIVEVGAGVQFANLISVNENQTSSHNDKNRYVAANGDTGYYTFRGTKLMAKFCFNPLALIPLKIWGKEDGKLYAEAAVLGLKSYPKNDSVTLLSPSTGSGKNYWGYDTLRNKTPITFGFNIPTFKLLDVLAIEAEWFGCPYPNSYVNRLGPGPNQSNPIPDAPKHLDYTAYDTDNWKWSVYLKKTFFDDHLGLIVQIARDHIRNETLMPESYDYEEALSKGNHWWWMSKIVAKF